MKLRNEIEINSDAITLSGAIGRIASTCTLYNRIVRFNGRIAFYDRNGRDMIFALSLLFVVITIRIESSEYDLFARL